MKTAPHQIIGEDLWLVNHTNKPSRSTACALPSTAPSTWVSRPCLQMPKVTPASPRLPHGFIHSSPARRKTTPSASSAPSGKRLILAEVDLRLCATGTLIEQFLFGSQNTLTKTLVRQDQLFLRPMKCTGLSLGPRRGQLRRHQRLGIFANRHSESPVLFGNNRMAKAGGASNALGGGYAQ